MPATYFLLVLFVGRWILLVPVVTFRVPEHAISEAVRAVESER